MKYNYCTLFDSGYLDKALVMIESLQKTTDSFSLYVLAMDDSCFEILKQMRLSHVNVISLEEFEDEELLEAKKNRSHTEYCWTCSSAFLYYLICQQKLENCTYIDADMLFYRSPNFLVDQVIDNGYSIGLMKHGFPDNLEGRHFIKSSGTYCVEFNTFINDHRGREALKWWKEQCLFSCAETSDGKVFGDQLYLENWTRQFLGVYEYDEKGAGVAPWNVMNYKCSGDKIIFSPQNKEVFLVFFHFHGVKIIDENTIFLNCMTRQGKKDQTLIKKIYVEYFDLIKKARDTLDLYGLKFSCEKINKTNIGTKNFLLKIKKSCQVGMLYLCLAKIRKMRYKKHDFLSVK